MARVLYMVAIEVAPEAEAEWDAWHNTQHIPEVLTEPGFLGARKFRDPDEGKDGWIRYLVHYELETPEALDQYLAGRSVVRIRKDHVDRFGRVTRLSRQIAVEVATFSSPLRIAGV